MSPESRSNGVFDAWINEICVNHHLATAISRTLLVDGDSICPSVDQSAYRCLIGSVSRSAGVGKGVFHATINSMPESFARAQLKLWRIGNELHGITESSWHTVLKQSLCNEKPALGFDLIKVMEASYGKQSVARALAELDSSVLGAVSVLWKPYTDLMVIEFCSRSAFRSAIQYAGNNDSLRQIVIDAIGNKIGAPKEMRTWPHLMKHMINRAHADDSPHGIMEQFKSAGSVVVDQILGMDESAISEHLTTDELRLMAFEWGLTQAVRHIDSMESKGIALDLALGL